MAACWYTVVHRRWFNMFDVLVIHIHRALLFLGMHQDSEVVNYLNKQGVVESDRGNNLWRMCSYIYIHTWQFLWCLKSESVGIQKGLKFTFEAVKGNIWGSNRNSSEHEGWQQENSSPKCVNFRHTGKASLLLLVCVSFTIIGQPRNSVLIRRV